MTWIVCEFKQLFLMQHHESHMRLGYPSCSCKTDLFGVISLGFWLVKYANKTMCPQGSVSRNLCAKRMLIRQEGSSAFFIVINTITECARRVTEHRTTSLHIFRGKVGKVSIYT